VNKSITKIKLTHTCSRVEKLSRIRAYFFAADCFLSMTEELCLESTLTKLGFLEMDCDRTGGGGGGAVEEGGSRDGYNIGGGGNEEDICDGKLGGKPLVVTLVKILPPLPLSWLEL